MMSSFGSWTAKLRRSSRTRDECPNLNLPAPQFTSVPPGAIKTRSSPLGAGIARVRQACRARQALRKDSGLDYGSIHDRSDDDADQLVINWPIALTRPSYRPDSGRALPMSYYRFAEMVVALCFGLTFRRRRRVAGSHFGNASRLCSIGGADALYELLRRV